MVNDDCAIFFVENLFSTLIYIEKFLKNVSQPVVAGNYVPNGNPLVQDINIYFQVANIYQHFIRTDKTQTISLLKSHSLTCSILLYTQMNCYGS
jgi:hypothetical protein